MRLRAWDNGGKTADRFTVLDLDSHQGSGLYWALGMCTRPTHPQGVSMMGTYALELLESGELGAEIPVESLPRNVREYAEWRFA